MGFGVFFFFNVVPRKKERWPFTIAQVSPGFQKTTSAPKKRAFCAFFSIKNRDLKVFTTSPCYSPWVWFLSLFFLVKALRFKILWLTRGLKKKQQHEQTTQSSETTLVPLVHGLWPTNLPKRNCWLNPWSKFLDVLPRKLTNIPWTLMVGRWLMSFKNGSEFQVTCCNFRGGKGVTYIHLDHVRIAVQVSSKSSKPLESWMGCRVRGWYRCCEHTNWWMVYI